MSEMDQRHFDALIGEKSCMPLTRLHLDHGARSWAAAVLPAANRAKGVKTTGR